MKKKITIVAVVVLVCVTAMVLAGCWFFNKNPFDTLTKHLNNKGVYDAENGTYVITSVDEEYDSTLKMIYNEAETDKVTLQYISEEGTLNLYLTKEKGNYAWSYAHNEYGDIAGNVNIAYDYDNSKFVEFAESSAALTEPEKTNVQLSIQLCLLNFDIYMLDNDISVESADFGIIMILD